MLYKRAKIIISILVFLIIVPLSIVHVARILFLGETFYPPGIASVLNNPYMGWAPSAEGGPYEQPHRLVYVNTTWRELEPEKAQYAFTSLEQKYQFSYWEEQGVNIIFRLNMDFPGPEDHKDIPDWLYEEIDGDGTWYDLDYGKGFSPNYSNPKLIAYHEKLLKALAARYNNHDLIPVMALGSIGHWGEWHTKQDPALAIPFPPVEISNQYVEHYLISFTNKFLVMRRPFNIARENKLGLYNDSFGNREQTDYFLAHIQDGYYDYLAGLPQPGMPDYWKYAPSGGEVANPPGMSCFENTAMNITLQQIRDGHTSWLGPSCPAYQPPGTHLQENYDLALKTMGYRFVLYSIKHPPKVKAGNALPVEMVWENNGAAPFYYPWPLELSLADASGQIVLKTIVAEDIRTWLPGKKKVTSSLSTPAELAEAKYTLCVAILSPDTGEPALELAIGNRRPDGRYTLDQVVITRP